MRPTPTQTKIQRPRIEHRPLLRVLSDGSVGGQRGEAGLDTNHASPAYLSGASFCFGSSSRFCRGAQTFDSVNSHEKGARAARALWIGCSSRSGYWRSCVPSGRTPSQRLRRRQPLPRHPPKPLVAHLRRSRHPHLGPIPPPRSQPQFVRFIIILSKKKGNGRSPRMSARAYSPANAKAAALFRENLKELSKGIRPNAGLTRRKDLLHTRA